MFKNQDLAKEQGLDEDFLTHLAETIENMDIDQWKQDFEEGNQPDSAMNADLQAQDQLAINLKIRDKPAVVVNGPVGTVTVQDAPDLSEIQAAISEVQ
jgi:protein-disulfide isomerase